MHYPDSRWQPRCQGKSRDDVSGKIGLLEFWMSDNINYSYDIQNLESQINW